jgi:hypothetical protein
VQVISADCAVPVLFVTTPLSLTVTFSFDEVHSTFEYTEFSGNSLALRLIVFPFKNEPVKR